MLQYQVRPDCTGYTRFANGLATAFVLVDVKGGVAGGFKTHVNSPGQYIAAEGTRIFP